MTKKIIGLIILLTTLGLLTQSESASQKTKIKVEGGIEVVYNPKTPEPSPGEAKTFGLEEELVIGGKETAFSQSVLLAVDAKHNVYVLDGQESMVRVFDSQGKFVRQFGRKGQGPGEFNMPSGIHLNPEGEVIVEDPLNQRLVYFSADGTFLRTSSTAKALGLSGLVMDSRGNFLGRQFAVTQNKMVWELKKYKPDLTPLFTIDTVDFVSPLEGKINPFELIIFYAVGPDDHIYYGKPNLYEITVMTPEGKPVRRIRKEYDHIKITEQDKKELLARIPEVGAAVKDRIVFPEYYPPYQFFSLDEEGRLLVRTYEKGKIKGEYKIDIFNQKGKLIGRAWLKASPVIWKDKKLYATEETEEAIIFCAAIG